MIDSGLTDNDPPRRSRARRREAMVSAIATIMGCLALVVMIATVVRVVMVKLWESAKVNPEYVNSVYENDLDPRWSGSLQQHSPLLSSENSSASQGNPSPNSAPTTLTSAPPQPQTHGTAHAPEMGSATASGSPVEAPSGIQNIDNKRSKIENAVRGFFEASGVADKIAFARDPHRVRPLMEGYYQNHAMDVLDWKALGWVLPVEETGYRLGYAQAIFANAEPVSLIIEEMEDGSFKVDWESSVRYGELDWREFVRTRPTSPKLFRVIASKPQHTPTDAAPEDSELLELKCPGEGDSIFAFFDRKDPKFQPLLQQLQSGNWKDVPLTLRLCYPGPTDSGKSVRIADVEGKGWLILQGTRS